MSALTKVEASCCPWCRCRIERDDAVTKVGHEWLHETPCAREYAAAQDENEAVLTFGTKYEYDLRRNAR